MKFLGMMLLLVAVMAMVGYARGWYTMQSQSSTTDGNQQINMQMDVNRAKIDQDMQKAKDMVQDAGQAMSNAAKTGMKKMAGDQQTPPASPGQTASDSNS